eukprot:gene13530-13656_t
MQQPRPLTAATFSRTELQRKEHEVSQLRIAALRALEQQAAEAQLREVEAALKVAKADAELAQRAQSQLQSQLPALQQQLLELQEKLRLTSTEKELQVAELTAEVAALRRQIQEQQDKATAAALEHANNNEQQLHQLQQRLQKALSKAASQHDEAREATAQLTSRLKEAERQLGLTTSERDALQAATNTNAVQDTSAEREVQGLLQQRDRASAALAEARDQLAAQEVALQQLRYELQQAKQPASAAVPGHLPNVAQVAAGGGVSARTHLLPSAQAGQQQVPRLALPTPSAPGPLDLEASGVSTLDLDLGGSLASSVDKLALTQRGGSAAWFSSPRAVSGGAGGQNLHSYQQDSAIGRGQGAGSSGGAAQVAATPGRPLSASADSAVWAALKAGGGAAGGARSVSDVARQAAQLLAGRGAQRQDHLASLRNSIEEAHLALLGAGAAGVQPRQLAIQDNYGKELTGPALQGAAAGSVEDTAQLTAQQAELAGALVAAEATNERLRAIIAALRKEMEDLQSAGGSAAAVPEAAAANLDKDGVEAAQEDCTAAAHGGNGSTGASASAANGAVQLAMLRAELSASDAELEHVMAHLDILQQQQQHIMAGDPASAELSELDFLRQRVATLLRDNRRFRRRAMQVQVAAAGGGGGATAELTSLTDAQSDQQQLPLPAGGDGAKALLLAGSDTGLLSAADGAGQAALMGAEAAAAQAEVSALKSALSDAEQELQLLSAENEKLMDLSNSLKAENNRLKLVGEPQLPLVASQQTVLVV